MPRPFFALMAAIVLALAPAGGSAAEPVTGHTLLAGKQVPLPAGEWILAGRGGITPFESVVLMKLAGREVQAFVIATTNTQPGTAGWGLTRDCARPDAAFTALDYASAVDGACRFVDRVATNAGPGAAPAWIAATDLAQRQGWTLPAQWLMAGVRLTDRRDVIDIRYHFADGRPDAAATWTTQALSAAERGLHGRLGTGHVLAMPDPASAAPARAAAQASPPPAAGGADWGVSLMKTISWRAVGTVGDLAVAYLFTGDPVLSGGLAATGAVVNSILYFGHELMWDQSGERPPLLEFAGPRATGASAGQSAAPPRS
ncbi:DUF2061 domain-containing protein [Azospirillum sp. sgz301742]